MVKEVNSPPRNPIACSTTDRSMYNPPRYPIAFSDQEIRICSQNSYAVRPPSLSVAEETQVDCGTSYSSNEHLFQNVQRRPSNRNESNGPHQYLDTPSLEVLAVEEQDLPRLPKNLYVRNQDEILSQVNNRLPRCVFNFLAKYQFPIPLESDKKPVTVPADRE